MADNNKPTAKQLRYRRALCEATGETTSSPRIARKPPARSSAGSPRDEAGQAIARGSGCGFRLLGANPGD